MASSTHREIILIDDDPVYIRLVDLVLRSLKFNGQLQQVTNPQKAHPLLAKRTGRKRTLILLDVNMPQKNGLTLLQEIRSTPSLRTIPVIVMSSHFTPEEIGEAYVKGANSCIVKPFELDEFHRVFESIVNYWFDVAAN